MDAFELETHVNIYNPLDSVLLKKEKWTEKGNFFDETSDQFFLMRCFYNMVMNQNENIL